MAFLRAMVLALVASAGPAVLHAQGGVTGTWELEMRWPDGSVSTGTCVFEQKGDVLSGTCGGSADRFPVTGHATADQVSWEVDVKEGGANAAMDFTGGRLTLGAVAALTSARAAAS